MFIGRTKRFDVEFVRANHLNEIGYDRLEKKEETSSGCERNDFFSYRRRARERNSEGIGVAENIAGRGSRLRQRLYDQQFMFVNRSGTYPRVTHHSSTANINTVNPASESTSA